MVEEFRTGKSAHWAYDWKIGIALIASFAATWGLFVSTIANDLKLLLGDPEDDLTIRQKLITNPPPQWWQGI